MSSPGPGYVEFVSKWTDPSRNCRNWQFHDETSGSRGSNHIFFFLSPGVPGGSPLSSDPTKGKVNMTKSYQICRMPFAARRDWNFARHIYIYICFFVGYHKRFVGQELLPSSHFSMNCISLTVPFSGCSLRIRMLHIIGNYTQASTELPCFFRPSFFWWKL